MEDQDRETRIDEDVEGHSHHAPNKAAPHISREDDGDDVEGHMFKQAPNKAAPNKA